MTEAEKKHKGILTVNVDYIGLAQAVENSIYMLGILRDKLDIAAIEKGIKCRERRRKVDRRKANVNKP